MQTQELNHKIIHDLRNYIPPISYSLELISNNLTQYQEKQKLLGNEIKDKEFLESIEFIKMLIPHSEEMMHYMKDLLDNQLVSKEIENGDDNQSASRAMKECNNQAVAKESSEFANNQSTIEDQRESVNGQLSSLVVEECNITNLVKELLLLNQGFIANHGIRIIDDIDDSVSLKTDSTKLKRILLNLITNAVKYSPRGNEVRIIVRNIGDKVACDSYNQSIERTNSNQNGNKVYIEIADSGIGMTQEEIAMALNGDGKKIDKSALDKEIDSHGIGMTIVKELVELLDGEMRIESAKGEGTRVGLEL